MEEIEEIEDWEKCDKESPQRYYYVSNLGRVKSITKGKKGGKERILKALNSSNGYLEVDIYNEHVLIHHLVAYAFLGPRPEGQEIDHLDRNSLNNKADNLRYCTRSENKQNRDDYRTDILETDRVERGKIFHKEWYEANKETINEKKKEKYTCECGSTLRKCDKARHERDTKKHLDWLANNS